MMAKFIVINDWSNNMIFLIIIKFIRTIEWSSLGKIQSQWKTWELLLNCDQNYNKKKLLENS